MTIARNPIVSHKEIAVVVVAKVNSDNVEVYADTCFDSEGKAFLHWTPYFWAAEKHQWQTNADQCLAMAGDGAYFRIVTQTLSVYSPSLNVLVK